MTTACPRCRCDRHRAVSIHNGQTIHHDCQRCGRFLAFVLWHGQPQEPTEPRNAITNLRRGLPSIP